MLLKQDVSNCRCTPEIVSEHPRRVENCQRCLQSIGWLHHCQRCLPSIINLEKRRANFPEEGTE